MAGAAINAEAELAKMMDPWRSGARGGLPDLNEPPPPIDEELEENADAAQAPKIISKASLDSSISKLENFLRAKDEAEASGSGGLTTAASEGKEDILRWGCFNHLIMELKYCGDDNGMIHNHAKWRAACLKVVTLENTDLNYLRNMRSELKEKGVESPLFKEVVKALVKQGVGRSS
ncbi:OLC1v1027909C1 [Oldenlandia corymbosa var. corymbosa]|uniref:OLC1v1027909C1 n=1 Tax=Oldenlandia corymbosa var. corymbosa TaxID=529605 RepID=A0AAV1CB47_OLDCO|nr:OLC1v1027909C1 [Oldenlandia corymbosa var. corymbosa]